MPKRIVGNIVGLPSPRSDWNQTDEMKADFIKNKPDIEKIQTDIMDLKTDALDLYGFKMYADEKLQELEAKQDSKLDKVDGYGLVAFESIMQIPGNEEVGFAILDDAENRYDTYNREYIKEKLNKKANVSDLDGFATKDELYPTPVVIPPTTLSANTSYEFGTLESLTLSFPTVANNGDVIYISFLSREGIVTNLTVDTTNTTDIDLIPDADTGYEIYAKYNNSLGKWIVKYSEYEVV